MKIRKANKNDLEAILAIYDEIHDREEKGEVTTGWIRHVYPVEKTAVDALERNDMFVGEDEFQTIVAVGMINSIQVDVYKQVHWKYPADDHEIMVLHTFIVSRQKEHMGLGTVFLKYYEKYALDHGCVCLRLDTNAKNKAARTFYKKHGFRVAGMIPTVFNGIEGVELVMLEKKLG